MILGSGERVVVMVEDAVVVVVLHMTTLVNKNDTSL